MRKTIIICTISFLYLGPVAQAQVVDTAFFQCLYKLDYINELVSARERADAVMLLVGEQYTFMGSYVNYKADSLLIVNPAEYSSQVTGGGERMHIDASKTTLRRSENVENYIIHRESGAVQCFGKAGFSRSYSYFEERLPPDWEIYTDTEEILGYPCQKAKTRYGGRDWTAWFAADIPIGEGPWLLRGLPGLILKAEDAEQHYVFECIQLGARTVRTIGIDHRIQYRNVSKTAFFEERRLVFEDIMVALKNSGITIPNYEEQLTPEMLKRVRAPKKYNPIERIQE